METTSLFTTTCSQLLTTVDNFLTLKDDCFASYIEPFQAHRNEIASINEKCNAIVKYFEGKTYPRSAQSFLLMINRFCTRLDNLVTRLSHKKEIYQAIPRWSIGKRVLEEMDKLKGLSQMSEYCAYVCEIISNPERNFMDRDPSDWSWLKNESEFPFPLLSEVAEHPNLRNWVSMMKDFDCSPFMKHPGGHLTRRLIDFYHLLVKVTAAGSHCYDKTSPFLRAGSFAAWNAYYTIWSDHAPHIAAQAHKLNGTEFYKFLWNLPESQGLKRVISLTFDKVSVESTFSIPNKPSQSKDTQYPFPPLPEDYLRQKLPIRLRLTSSDHLPFSPFSKMEKTTTLNLHAPIQQNQESEHILGGLYGKITVDYPMLPETSDSLIFHVHGGGFVAMTSLSHGVYVRKWACETGCPVLSVDYRLAPEYPFPIQLEECYQAYKWALENSALIGSTARKIIAVGDSAGGNLIAGVVFRAILDGIKVPDSVILGYPAMFLEAVPSCSRVISCIDPLLSSSLLLNIMDAYSSKVPPNMFLSPGLAPPELLSKFPPTKLIVGEFDPLLDDSIFFYNKLKACTGPDHVTIDIEPGLGHGFFNLIQVVPEAYECATIVSSWICEVLGKKLEKNHVVVTFPEEMLKRNESTENLV